MPWEPPLGYATDLLKILSLAGHRATYVGKYAPLKPEAEVIPDGSYLAQDRRRAEKATVFNRIFPHPNYSTVEMSPTRRDNPFQAERQRWPIPAGISLIMW